MDRTLPVCTFTPWKREGQIACGVAWKSLIFALSYPLSSILVSYSKVESQLVFYELSCSEQCETTLKLEMRILSYYEEKNVGLYVLKSE